MKRNSKQKHEHFGMTSNGIFDDRKVLCSMALKKGQTFLDGGCADGHFSLEASRMVGKGGRVHAVDVHEPSIKILKEVIKKRGIQNIQVHLSDLREEIHIKPVSIDHFFMSNVMHGFVLNNEVESVMRNIMKALKPTGQLTLLEWNKENVGRGPPEDQRLSVEEAVSVMEPYDFIPKKIQYPTKEHFMVMFVKKNQGFFRTR